MRNIFEAFLSKPKSVNTEVRVQETEEEPIESILSMTYANILNLKRNCLLDTSKRYRMVDYVTTTKQKHTKSGLHRFDLLLTPVSDNEFSREAKALLHDGDEYFKKSDLGAWIIYYDIENNTDKYEWADPTQGKGVIYYMADELGNKAPYDFKNIMFKRWAVKGDNDKSPILFGNIDRETEISHSREVIYEKSEFYYTFSTLRYGNQVLEPTENKSDKYDHLWVCDMTVEPFRYPFKLTDRYGNDMCYGNIICASRNMEGKLTLNDNVFVGFPSYWERKEGGKATLSVANISYNILRGGCIGNTLCGNSTYDIFLEDCKYNSLYGNCSLNTFGHCCNANTLTDKCNDNRFGDMSNDNVIEQSSNNYFEDHCSGNVLDMSNGNFFKSACVENKLKESNYNVFGLGCTRNELLECYNNKFGNMCSKNDFGSKCRNNVFENECIENSFGDNCSNNKLYSNVSYIDMEKDNTYNTFMGNNYFINLHGGIQNIIVHQHISGESKENPFEREMEPAVAYNHEIIVNKENVVEIK